ncbi:hypothetical protein BDI24065_01139 [Burkholderia diffusa]|uniref:Uncharacterized protein n=1 Tax=Burkholderia diffusa TaxID=488732 RepID=A0A6P2I9D3_9BURK|nr:hypothetical protein BDI24065_01139 [Burkholderia diffusa]
MSVKDGNGYAFRGRMKRRCVEHRVKDSLRPATESRGNFHWRRIVAWGNQSGAPLRNV